MSPKKIHSTCYMCTDDCPITVVAHGDEIISVKHPECVRAGAMIEQRESSLRRIHPRVRSGFGAPWTPTSSASALSTAAEKLLDLKERYGAGAIAFVSGFTKEARPYLQRLAHAFGSPHYLTESSCCFGSCYVAAAVTLGKEYAYFLGPSRTRSSETRCRLFWTNNPTESRLCPEGEDFIRDASEMPTIVVDPRVTPIAEAAEIHLRPRPGTDGALALGMAGTILAEGLEDGGFLREFAYGLARFRQYAREFSPERAAQITGIPPDEIVDAARLYATSRPAQITISPSSTTHHSNGFQSHRAILLLAALCGNLDVVGGNRPWGHRLTEASIDLSMEEVGVLGHPIGAKEHPVFVEYYGEGQAMRLADAIESNQIKGVFSIGMNVSMWPNSNRLGRALESLEFFSVSDFFDTPTTQLATAFFPAATHLEREALVVGGNGRIQYRPAVVAPRGEALGDSDLVIEMAKAMGLKERFWEGDLHASFNARLAGTGLLIEDLPASGRPLHVQVPDPGKSRYQAEGFGTPTGKVEFVSTILEDAGHDGLPVFHEPYWSPVSTPDLARSFPLILTTGARTKTYTHSQGRQLAILKNREPGPKLQMNPFDASARGIADGEEVRLSSPLGSITLSADITETTPRGVVAAPHGWAEADVNILIPDQGLDPISGFPPFKSSLCQVERLD